jgi:hypothetical protein
LLLREEVGIAVPVIHSSLWAISFTCKKYES